MGWACGTYGWGEGVYRVLVGKPEGRRPLGRPRRRWVDNIRLDLQEVGCGYMDWIGLAQDRDRWWTLVSVIMNLRVPWNAGNFLTSCKPVSFSRRTLQHGVLLSTATMAAWTRHTVTLYVLWLSCWYWLIVIRLETTGLFETLLGACHTLKCDDRKGFDPYFSVTLSRAVMSYFGWGLAWIYKMWAFRATASLC